MFTKKYRSRKFDYTPLYYNENKRDGKGGSKIHFRRGMMSGSKGFSFTRLIMYFIVAVISYIYLKYYF
jgi:hypothetical protein